MKHFLPSLFLAVLPLAAQTPVPLGEGSYASEVPASEHDSGSYFGLPAVQVEPLTAEPALFSTLHLDPALADRPIPTNQWWTDLLAANRSYLPNNASLHVMQQDKFGGNQWAYPGMAAPRSYGLDVYFPNAWKPANPNGSPQGGIDFGPALQVRSDRGFEVPPEDVMIADFEGAGYPAGWTVTTFDGFASAFPGTPTQGTWTGQAPVPNGYLSNGYLNTFLAVNGAGGDARRGILTSPAFTVEKQFIHLIVGGGDDVTNTVVQLKVAGNVVATTVGQRNGTMSWKRWDVSAYEGQSATIEVVDTSSAGWGFIMCDNIVQSDSPDPVGRYGRDMTSTGNVVTGWGDWTVDFKLPAADGNSIDVTLARGVPFTWTTWSDGINPRLITGATTFYDTANQPIAVTGGSFTADAFSFEFQGRVFGVFLPDGTVCTVSGSGATTEVIPQLSGAQNFMVIGYLPTTGDLASYANFAFARPTNTQLSWVHDKAAGVVNTTWTLTTTPLKGTNLDTLQGWLPHHTRTTQHALPFSAKEYLTPRGIMKLAPGRVFQIGFPFKGFAPVLPAPAPGAPENPYLPARMTNYMNQFNPGSMIGDTYWAAKALALCAEQMMRAREMGDTENFTRLRNQLRTAMENWLTYTPGEPNGFFTVYPNWRAFIGFDSSYGSQAFNDLHFHYGYFAVAGALLGSVDPEFLADYGPMLRKIVKSYGNWDRADTSSPFLRTFDVWAGHSNAGGLSGGNGNNQESSSEAMQSWGGLFMLGRMMQDDAMAAAGAMGFAMESCAVNEYWQDLYETNFSPNYNRAGTGILTADSIAYGTYFSGDPAWVYGIQYAPANHWLSYMTRSQPEVVAAKYQAMWDERLAWCRSMNLWSAAGSFADGAWVQWNDRIYSASGAVAPGSIAPGQPGAPWNLVADCSRSEPDVLGESPGHIVMCYQALWAQDTAAAQFDNYFTSGASIATGGQAGSTYYLIHALRTLGEQDFSYSASEPTSSVYWNADTSMRTYVAYNPHDTTQPVTFYQNGVAVGTMTVPARVTVATQDLNYTASAPPLPADGSALATSGQVALRWGASSLATSYILRRATSATGPYSTIATIGVPTYNDTGLNGGAQYFYTLSAVNSAGESAPSSAVSAIIPATPASAVNCGGSASASFAADGGFTGGSANSVGSPIDTTGLVNPAPQSVYQTNRFGNHSYTLGGLTGGGSYTVRLHFAETYWEAIGARVFHININGVRAQSDFDIFATAGAKNKAVIREFPATANAGGQIAVQFVTVTDNAQVNGIEIYAPPPQGISAWRLLHFGTTENTGTAADDFDANGDGEKNLLEFATAQNPHASTRAMHTLETNAPTLTYNYTRASAADAAGVSFIVEWSDTLESDSWSSIGVSQETLSDNGTLQSVKATMPPGLDRRFVRLRVTGP